MIDIHTHILPGIDDGAEDMYDVLEMASIAVESGTVAIVATPHCNIPGLFDNYYSAQYIKIFKETEAAIQKEGIPLKLYAGMEVFMAQNVPELLYEGRLLTINGSRYMLVEFEFDEDPDYVQAMLQKVKQMGIRPIIAHAERYDFVQDDLNMVYQWIRNGYSVQVNKGSLLGRFGKWAKYVSHRLLRHNLVTVIASDAHGPYQRTPYMLDAYDELSAVYPESYIKVLFNENPKRICKNFPIVQFEPIPFEEDE